MSRLFYHVMQDNAGNLLFDVSGTMRIAGSGTLATIYGDEALTIILPNPMTNHPSFGSFKCFLDASAAGYDFYMAKAGYTFETLTGVQGLGTMAQQNANAVAITGGTALNLTRIALFTGGNPAHVFDTGAGTLSEFGGSVGIGRAPDVAFSLSTQGAMQTAAALIVGTQSTLMGAVGVGGSPSVGNLQTIYHNKTTETALKIYPGGSDTGGGRAVQFMNIAAVETGAIFNNATTTTYATTSDARLKHAVTALTGALDVVRALRPVAHLWRVDDSPGVGFLADEVQQVIPAGVVTGEKDAVDADGVMSPQMIDMSKLVPYLTAALKEALERIDALTARLDAAGA